MTQNPSNVIKMPGVTSVPAGTPKTVKSTMDTVILTPEGLKSWKAPPFQRPLRVNPKLQAIAEELKHNGGVIPGIITIGIVNREKFLIDGQHRVEAFKISGLGEAYADMRICHFDTMAEMGDEFVKLNSQIVKLRPDDLLRGLEGSIQGLQSIRKECPFIGYDMIRRGERAPILSMSIALRVWCSSAPEIPSSAGMTAREIASHLDTDETNRISHFYSTCLQAWGRDHEYSRAWGTLNLTIVAWLWRRVVISHQTNTRVTKFTPQQFLSGMRALTASSDYMDWLTGRVLTDRDRSPCYERIKTIFVKRLQPDHSQKIILPQPAWTSGGGRKQWMSRV